MDFQGKVAIITGASAGIGRAYALAFAKQGATVIAVARTLGDLESGEPGRNTLAEVVKAGEGLPGRIYAHVCDLSVEADIKRLADQTVANYGRIDVLVNNAGIYPHYDTFKITEDEWNLNMGVNVRAPYLTVKYCAPYMVRQKSGSIINLTSASAQFWEKGHPGHDDLLLYCVTKAALNRMTTFLSEDLKEHGIAVNALSPGAVLTDTWRTVDPKATDEAEASGWGKQCTPEIMGPALLYLAKQTASGITGQILHTDTFRKTWPEGAAA